MSKSKIIAKNKNKKSVIVQFLRRPLYEPTTHPAADRFPHDSGGWCIFWRALAQS